MSFWWGYALASMSRGGTSAGSGLGGLIIAGGFIAVVMELITPAPPKEITLDDYKLLVTAAGASCTGMSVLAHHARRPGGIRSDALPRIQDLLVDRIRQGDRTVCGLTARPVVARLATPAKPRRVHPVDPVRPGPTLAHAVP